MASPNAFAYPIIDERLNLEEEKSVEISSKRNVVEPDISSASIDTIEPFSIHVQRTKWRRLDHPDESLEQHAIATLQADPSKEGVDGLVDDNQSQSGDGTISQLSDLSKSDESGDPIDDRLNLLQRLVPRASEVDSEEILKVVVDYVKTLEREIQMFHDSIESVPETMSSNSGVDGIFGNAMNAPSKPGVNVLQERGLCIVPLSVLSKGDLK